MFCAGGSAWAAHGSGAVLQEHSHSDSVGLRVHQVCCPDVGAKLHNLQVPSGGRSDPSCVSATVASLAFVMSVCSTFNAL
eukprot:457431-Rhodomonas_salina.1